MTEEERIEMMRKIIRTANEISKTHEVCNKCGKMYPRPTPERPYVHIFCLPSLPKKQWRPTMPDFGEKKKFL